MLSIWDLVSYLGYSSFKTNSIHQHWRYYFLKTRSSSEHWAKFSTVEEACFEDTVSRVVNTIKIWVYILKLKRKIILRAKPSLYITNQQIELDMYQNHMEINYTSGFHRLLVDTEPMRDRLRPLMFRCSKETDPPG